MVVLLADDSPTQRALWMFTFNRTHTDSRLPQGGRKSRARLITAGDAGAALAVLRESQVDLLITDIDMPGQNGWYLAAAAQLACPNLKVLIHSSHVRTGETLPEGLAPGRTFIISKKDRELAVQMAENLLDKHEQMTI